MPNYFHLFLKTVIISISPVMKRLLTGYAIYYNRRHKRYGHLFQNRYKSILCREDSYLLELIRYVHLNPLRAKLVSDIKELGDHPCSGHSVLMGRVTAEWQNTTILGLFGDKVSVARWRYLEFVKKGLSRKLVISQAAVSLSVSRGRRIALENHYEIGNL